MKEERAICENNSKGVENQQGKDVWVISVHKCRYQNGKADKKIFQQKYFIKKCELYWVHVFHKSTE